MKKCSIGRIDVCSCASLIGNDECGATSLCKYQIAPEQLESDKAARGAFDALLGVMSIVAETDGVVGYYPDGEVAKWSEFQEIKEAIAAIASVTGPGGADPILLERLARITESTGQEGAA